MRLEAVPMRTRGNTAVLGHSCHRSGESVTSCLLRPLVPEIWFNNVSRSAKDFSLLSTRTYRFLGQHVQWTSGAGSLEGGREVNRWGLEINHLLRAGSVV